MLRYTASAMVRDDHTLQDSQLLSWLRSVRSHLNLPPEFLRDAYSTLRESVRESTPEDAFAFLEPFLAINVKRLGSPLAEVSA